ncbi:MAG: glycoside hydrolase family 127 protein [Clostridia bacterium]|nr:glycoside hydrolase family 127 protein [Clostridia bacterium]
MGENIRLLNDRLEAFPLSCVTLLDPYEKNAFELEIKYLKSLDPDRLLRGFYDIAGKKGKAELYGGWETSSIQGHTMGHYLTALAQAFAACGDRELKTTIDYIIDSLCECQAENGYLAAIPEEHYTRLETGNTEGTWVPWYSMHKILSGLVAVYKFTGRQKALDIASRLGDWVFDKTIYWDAEMQKTVLNIEYGGMNDCLYDLYSLTLKKEHLVAAHCFDELPLFTALYKGEDILDGKHANTTIPKFLGAANRYFVLGEGEEFYLLAAEKFWDTVINNHSYITGGNSEWEHFGTPQILDAERTECNCETCNTYNMLKLTRKLFMLTGDRKYRDFYERTFINAILSSQNPETGMTTYFQPMATGFFKVYSSPFDHFWCCTGSGMENFSKLGDSIYFKDNNSIFINRFTSSTVKWAEKGITLTQGAELPKVCFTVEGNADFSLVIPLPSWCKDAPTVKINKEAVKVTEANGFITLDRHWQNGDEVECILPMNLDLHRLPDNKNAICFTCGPYVLSADLGKDNMATSVTGVNVTIPLADKSESGKINVKGDAEEWLAHIEDNFEPTGEKYSFRLKNADRELIFAPHYKKYDTRYGIYFVVE